MEKLSIHQLYEDDHRRLDALFDSFKDKKHKDPKRAKEVFQEFSKGLEQHMAWEESILFPEYDDRLPNELNVTEELRDDHSQLLDQLRAIERKLERGDLETGREEARLSRILDAHNRSEEQGLYPKLEGLLSDAERREIRQKMRDATW